MLVIHPPNSFKEFVYNIRICKSFPQSEKTGDFATKQFFQIMRKKSFFLNQLISVIIKADQRKCRLEIDVDISTVFFRIDRESLFNKAIRLLQSLCYVFKCQDFQRISFEFTSFWDDLLSIRVMAVGRREIFQQKPRQVCFPF